MMTCTSGPRVMNWQSTSWIDCGNAKHQFPVQGRMGVKASCLIPFPEPLRWNEECSCTNSLDASAALLGDRPWPRKVPAWGKQ